MSFEARLRVAFNRAADNRTQPAEEVLAGLIATYHAQRRQRAMFLAAAAAVFVATLSFGDGAVRWIQGLDEAIPPAERTDHPQEEGRSLKQVREQEQRRARPQNGSLASLGNESTMTEGRRVLVMPPGTRQGSGTFVTANPPDARSDGPALGQGHADGSSETDSESDPIYTRRERQNWSPHDPRSGRTTFTLAHNERFIGVRLWGTGGFGTSYGIRAEVYEVVDGEAELLKKFCTYSGLLAVTPGATIEVRPIQGGCDDGNNFTLKGTTSVRFYR